MQLATGRQETVSIAASCRSRQGYYHYLGLNISKVFGAPSSRTAALRKSESDQRVVASESRKLGLGRAPGRARTWPRQPPRAAGARSAVRVRPTVFEVTQPLTALVGQ